MFTQADSASRINLDVLRPNGFSVYSLDWKTVVCDPEERFDDLAGVILSRCRARTKWDEGGVSAEESDPWRK